MNICVTTPLFEIEDEKKLTECDSRVVAAIIDCEGTIRVKKATCKLGENPSYHVITGVRMTTEPIISYLNTLCPGNTHHRTSQNARHKPIYSWHLESQSKTRYLLKQILPFLMVKGKQAKLCLNLLNLQREWGNHSIFPATIRRRIEEIYCEVKLLNKRGTGGS